MIDSHRAFAVVTGWVCAFALGLCAAAHAEQVAAWDAAKSSEAEAPDLSGKGNDAALHAVAVMKKQEDLVERPYFHFDGRSAYAEAANSESLNPARLTITAWFKPDEGSLHVQRPILAKSLPAHAEPWYQYALTVMDMPGHPSAVSLYFSLGGKLCLLEACDVVSCSGWNFVAATFDGKYVRLFCNGKWVASRNAPPGKIDSFDTPLLIGAYGNLPKTAMYCFAGCISTLAVYDAALSDDEIRDIYERDKDSYPGAEGPAERTESDYEKRLNRALRQRKDVWGEELVAKGGATYENVKDHLRPLFYSTGHTNKELGVHNLLFGPDGGDAPYIVPLADGSRIAADVYNSPRFVDLFVGKGAKEKYGSRLEKLEGPLLEGGYYPILQTRYTDAQGVQYSQECFAGSVSGVPHLCAFGKLTATSGKDAPDTVELRLALGGAGREAVRTTGSPEWRDAGLSFRLDLSKAGGETVYFLWSPKSPLPDGTRIDADAYERAKAETRRYWDEALARGALFDVPEELVMNVQRNLLIQNLIMRWRYSAGAVVYNCSFYQPESSEAVTSLGHFGFLSEFRDGLNALVGMSKGEGADYYCNWEKGEKLTHGAYYYFLTRDAEFVKRNTAAYESYCESFRKQIEADPNGLLRKERHCGDIPTKAYATFHQAICWRGLRDMAQVWRCTGRDDLHARYAPLADRFRDSLHKALAKSNKTLPDGSLFVPSMLLEDMKPFDPITATRLGSYWNLCMPFAFATDLWDPNGADMDAIVKYLHEHGATMLGLIRFNYYPTPIGSFRAGGLPGYYTTGFDNVYLPSYVQLMADRDEAERLVLSFYGKLAHGMTRNTFVCGEGASVGARPTEFYRSCYGTPCSGNNAGFLLALRLMLVRESFDPNSGLPEALLLAHATPRQWLEDGKEINVRNSPTCFGPVSYSIRSELGRGRLTARVDIPQRNAPGAVRLKLRTPGRRRMKSVTVNGREHDRFNPETELIDLTGHGGTAAVVVEYELRLE